MSRENKVWKNALIQFYNDIGNTRSVDYNRLNWNTNFGFQFQYYFAMAKFCKFIAEYIGIPFENQSVFYIDRHLINVANLLDDFVVEMETDGREEVIDKYAKILSDLFI